MTRFKALVLAASAAVASTFLIATPAHATNGATAWAACETAPGCRGISDSRGIVIVMGNGDGTNTTIYCADDDAECIVVARRQPPALSNQTAMDNVAGASTGPQRPMRPGRPFFAGRPDLARR